MKTSRIATRDTTVSRDITINSKITVNLATEIRLSRIQRRDKIIRRVNKVQDTNSLREITRMTMGLDQATLAVVSIVDHQVQVLDHQDLQVVLDDNI